MNDAYTLIWSTTHQAWVAVGELAKGRKKSSAKVLKLAVFMLVSIATGIACAVPAVNTLPTGESVAAGAATFDRAVTNELTIHQSSARLITNWNSFDIGSSATVSFVQPDTASIALNRVVAGNPTEIFGQLVANGRLVIVNPNGITFGANSQVRAASIIGSVLDIQDDLFNSDTLLFNRGIASGTINNQGSLTATAGSLYLLAPTIKNSGSMAVTGGNAGLINVNAINLTPVDPAVTATSSITGLIQQSGSISATQVNHVGGKILLTGDTSQAASQIQLAGMLDATNTYVHGLSIAVNGDVNLNGVSNVLDLTSSNGYSLTHGAVVNLNGASSGFSVNGTAYTVIRDVNQLQDMNNDLSGRYVLANHVDASSTFVWAFGAGFERVGSPGTPFNGILDGLGHRVDRLRINRDTTGSGLFGATHSATIQNLGLNNVGMTFTRSAGPLVGIILGGTTTINNVYSSGSLTVSPGFGGHIGGLVGAVTAGGSLNLSNSYSAVNITATQADSGHIGGLVGTLNTGNNHISTAYYAGNLNTQVANVGGIYGGVSGSPTSNNTLDMVYASGLVSGSSSKGGLVGTAGNLSLSNSYWNTSKSGLLQAVGNAGAATLSNVSGLTSPQFTQLSSFAGWGSSIDAQYGTDSIWRIYDGQSEPLLRSFLKPLTVTGAGSKIYDATTDLSGFSTPAGTDTSKILGTAAYSGSAVGARNVGNYTRGVSGLYSSQQGYDLTFDNGDFVINKAAMSVYAGFVSKTYDGTTSVNGGQYVVFGNMGSDTVDGATLSFADKHAGTGKRVVVSNALVNDGNNGANYNVTYVDNVRSTINKASLSIGAANVSKTYDGTTLANSRAVVTQGSLFAGDTLNGATFNFADKHVGAGKAVRVSAAQISDGNNGDNYAITYIDNINSSISKANLLISSSDVSKTYDGTTLAAGTAVATAGTQVFTGDSLSGGTFAFDNRNAGMGKTVMVSGVIVNDGNNGNNYVVNYVDNNSSTINRARLQLTSNDVTKTYDGTTTANASAVISSGSLFGSDSISGGSFAFVDKHAGTGKHVVVSGVTVNDGNNGNNYDVGYVDNNNSTINKKLLIINAVMASKEYDGKLNSSAKPVVIGRVRADSIAGLTQSYSDKNVGTGKTISIDAGYAIRDGNNGNNYDVFIVNNPNGVITPKALNISTVSNSKVYDGGVTSANKPLISGLVYGDRVTGLFQQYADKTVGENKQLLVKDGYLIQDGNGGNNYTITEQTSNDGVISAH